ncbi:MAG: TIGR02391 family protein [Actinomycetaceae bacterium]|nr:TIGR02391 family protein [Actinomycetaceae bacterium]
MAGNPPMFRTFGHEPVTIVHAAGTEDERRFEVEAYVNADYVAVTLGTPVYEGDIIEHDDHRGGKERLVVLEVRQHQPPSRYMQYTEIRYSKVPVPRVSPVRRLTIQNLHPRVIEAAGALFADGHFDTAISEAFKSLEIRVRGLIGSQQSGVKLVGEAFGGDKPKLNISRLNGQSGKDEQEGFLALFRGAMLAVRNPHAHEAPAEVDAQEALEYLGFASLLHRRLDITVS